MTDTRTTNPGELLERMVVVARLWERLGPLHPGRAPLDRILQQMLLFSRMTDRLGIAAPRNPLMRAVLREAELGCVNCTASGRCRTWLDGHAAEDDYREFCPNEGLFAVLPRQENVNRPYAVE